MNEWDIQSRAHGCQACARPFADKQPYHTVLFDEKQQFHRLDVCEACWKEQYSQGTQDRKGFISYWNGVYEAPPAAPPDPIQKENAESLLRKLIELNDPRYIAAGFILAVMLERKRLLKVKEQLVRDGQRVFLYEQPRTGDLFTIPDPNLRLDQLDQVQKDVAELLEKGLNLTIPQPSAADGPASVSPQAPAAPNAAPDQGPIPPITGETAPAVT